MKKSSVLSLLLAGGIVFSSFSPTFAATSNDIVASAEKYIGYSLKNYSAGDFVQYTLKGAGISVSNDLSTLYSQGTPVPLSKLNKGDIAFFGTSSSNLTASGVYLGNNQIAVAYKPFGSVKVLSTNDSLVKNNFVGLRSFVSVEEPAPTPKEPTKPAINEAQKVIDAGLKYLGTPYEYGSSRSNTNTFDCSDFVRQAFLDGVGLDIGRGGATSHYNYLKSIGAEIKTDWRDLKVGDIMFFMPYKGTSKSNYTSDRDRIGHNGIYMGDGKVLHTYSKDSGGVRIDSIANRHWEFRFIGGGSPLK